MGNEFSAENLSSRVQNIMITIEDTVHQLASDDRTLDTFRSIFHLNEGEIDQGEIQEAVSETFSSVSREIQPVFTAQPFIERINNELAREGVSMDDRTENVLSFIESDAEGIENFFEDSEEILNMQKFYIFYLYTCKEVLKTKEDKGVGTALTAEELEKIQLITQMYSQLNLLDKKIYNVLSEL